MAKATLKSLIKGGRFNPNKGKSIGSARGNAVSNLSRHKSGADRAGSKANGKPGK